MTNENDADATTPGDDFREPVGMEMTGDESVYSDSAVDRAKNLLEATPQQIGRYRILERLGHGGMGDVYRAEQRSPIRREVALKLIKLGMDTRLVVARFEAERQALAMMDHPHIAKVYSAGVDPTGRPYFVMEYVKGVPVTEYADANHLTVAERLEVFQQVCHAIQHAHQKGVIHRDLKPSNVLVATQDGKPFAKVIDFGIAKATGQRLTDKTLFTEHDQFIGTPLYMSPEQAAGSLDIDTRTDVYSLGVLLYELLTGTTPFTSEEMKSGAAEYVRKMIREVEPPKPSTRLSQSGQSLPGLAASRKTEPKKLGVLVRGELDWIVMKALDKERARRYDSPAAFGEDLERHLSGRPVRAAPPSLVYRGRKFARKNRYPLTAAAIAVSTLILGLIGTAQGLVRAREALVREQQATTRESSAREDAQLQAYVANIGAAQVAMQGESWPEARQRLAACDERLRGWEWHYLSTKASAPAYGFPQSAESVRMSRNGKYAVGRNRQDVSIFDLEARRRTATITTEKEDEWKSIAPDGGYNPVYEAVADDGRIAVKTGETITLFGVDGKKLSEFRFAREEYAPDDLYFGPCGRVLMVTRRDISVPYRGSDLVVYDLTSGKRTLKVEKQTGEDAVLSPDDELTCVFSETKAEIYRNVSGALQTSLNLNGEKLGCVAFTPDCKSILVGTGSGRILVYGVGGADPVRTLACSANAIVRMTVSRDGRHIASVDEKGMVRVALSTTGEVLAEVRDGRFGARTNFPQFMFSDDGTQILSGAYWWAQYWTEFDLGQSWHWQRGGGVAAVEAPCGVLNGFGWSPDGKRMLSVDAYRLRLWDAARPDLSGGDTWQPAVGGNPQMPCATFGPVAIGLDSWQQVTADAVLTVIEQGKVAGSSEATASPADGRWMADPGLDHTVVIRDAGRRTVIRTLAGHEGRVTAMAATPDGRRLITSGEDGTVRFWDTSLWREVAVVRTFVAARTMAFTADGSRLVMAFEDRTVQSWDARPAETRNTEKQARLEEQRRRSGEVTAMLEGDIPWTRLASTVVERTDLTPGIKMAVLFEMDRQLQEVSTQAAVLVEGYKKRHILKSTMLTELAGADLSRSLKRAAEHALRVWEQKDSDVVSDAWARGVNPDLDPSSYGETIEATSAIHLASPANTDARQALALCFYRAGQYKQAVDTLASSSPEALRARNTTQESRGNLILALASYRLGQTSEAQKFLRTGVRGRDPSGTRLRLEAASLINPATTRPATRPSMDAVAYITDAIDGSDMTLIKSKVGQRVKIKGLVGRVQLVMRGDAANILLAPDNSGLLVWVKHSLFKEMPKTFLDNAEGRWMTATGEINPYASSNWEYDGRLQLTLDSLDDLKFVPAMPTATPTPPTTASPATAASPPPATVPPPTAAISSSQTAIDAQDLATLSRMTGQIATVTGVVTETTLTSAKNAANVLLEPRSGGVLVWVSSDVFAKLPPGFFDRSDYRYLRVTGKVGPYGGFRTELKGRTQISVTSPDDLKFDEPTPATSWPTTQPAN